MISKCIVVLMFGGDVLGMNVCICVIVVVCEGVGYIIIGFEYGYNGFFE